MGPPRYTHDCTACIFQGRSGKFDLYFCHKAESDCGGTVVARYGNEGHEYASGPISCYLVSDIEKGLVPHHDALCVLARRLLQSGVVRLSIDTKELEVLRDTWAPM